ncbi:MAG: SatD family protein [Porphyromonadaceae bacterium]|nr:SatD family protein [Porphyromonadaceae bacterium]
MNGIITGDIIDSTSIPIEHRKDLLTAISVISEELQVFSPLKCEIYRGDSFQIVVNRPEMAMLIAILLRAGLKSRIPKGSKQNWDARIAVGIGEMEFISDSILVSDGEAFRLSGREFDELGKRNLAVRTRWEDANEELKISTAFADDIITNWTSSQSLVIYMSLAYQMTQKEIADKLGQSSQNISKLSNVAKEKLIRTYINRCTQIIMNKQP